MTTRHSAAVTVLLAAVVVPVANAVIINVPGDQPTIQAGIDAAMNGDEVVVADGVYTGPGNRELQTGTKLITVRSASGPDTCIIDCVAAGRAFVISGGARIDGFTVRNGLAVQGGAVLVSGDTTIIGCVFEGNSANLGGGIYVVSSSPTIVGCRFSQNSATGDGGAIYNLYGSPALFNCLMSANSAAELGGAIFSDLAWLSLTNCTLTGNTAHSGGGIANYAGVEMTLSNCILWANLATVGDVFSAQLWSTSSSETVNYTCIEDLSAALGGEGNIDADPLFVDPAGDDFHLLPGSPCIDAGNNTAVPKGITTDLDGNPRFVDDPYIVDTGNGDPPIVDMGAYELCLWDCGGDHDGNVGIVDFLGLLSQWDQVGTSCDFGLGDPGVGVNEFLDVLANWGPCP